MRSAAFLGPEQIQAFFTDEISACGGMIREVFNDGFKFFARSVLPTPAEILPGDRVQGGVAIRAVDDQIAVHPYTFRLVCSNGAIMARSTGARIIDLSELFDVEQAELAIREAIQLCIAPESFAAAADQMRSAAAADIDLLLAIAPMLSRTPTESQKQLMSQLIERVSAGRRGTRYDLMNVVTATARGTRDPEAKWRLEELGGAIAADDVPTPHPEPSARSDAQTPELVS